MPWARAVGVRTFGRACLRVRRLPEHRVSTPALGEHELGAVLARPVEHHVDRRTTSAARSQRHTFDDHRIVRPFVEADRVAVKRFDARPCPRGPKQQVSTGLWDPQQQRQPRVLVRVDRNQQFLHELMISNAWAKAATRTAMSIEGAGRMPRSRHDAGLRVAGVFSGLQAGEVFGFDLGWWSASEAVHEPPVEGIADGSD
jgi:hypothetical protein